MKASRFLITLLVVTSASLSGWAGGACSTLADRFSDFGLERQVFSYRMKGKVRLLLFWVGKDDVGGGHVAVMKGSNAESEVVMEAFEVLFGSNPARVPGRINRWGYGREWFIRDQATNGLNGVRESVFEGYMRKSDEESLSEVRKNEAKRQAGEGFLYEGIRSRVVPGDASSEKWRFVVHDEFDYRTPQQLDCRFLERSSQPPDDVIRLDRADIQPVGFLSAINSFVSRIVDVEKALHRRDLKPLDYAYNARLYTLRVRDIDYRDRFSIPLPGKLGRREFRDVAEIKFDVRRKGSRKGHTFVLWVPRSGEYQGIPVRIVDRPRWWLRIELNLEPVDRPLPSEAAAR